MELWLVTFRHAPSIARFVVIAESEREAIMIAWEACRPAGVNIVFRPEHGTAQLVSERCLWIGSTRDRRLPPPREKS